MSAILEMLKLHSHLKSCNTMRSKLLGLFNNYFIIKISKIFSSFIHGSLFHIQGFYTTVPVILGLAKKLCARSSNPAIITECHSQLSRKPKRNSRGMFFPLAVHVTFSQSRAVSFFLLLSDSLVKLCFLFSVIQFLLTLLSSCIVLGNTERK